MTKKILACVCAVLLLIGGFLAGRLSAPKIKTEPPAEPVTTTAPEVTEPEVAEPEPEPELKETGVVSGWVRNGFEGGAYGNTCVDVELFDTDENLHITESSVIGQIKFGDGEIPFSYLTHSGEGYELNITCYETTVDDGEGNGEVRKLYSMEVLSFYVNDPDEEFPYDVLYRP